MKPSSYLTLKTGKALAAFTGFVSMFNWMEKFLYYIRSKTSTITISDPDNNEKYSLDIAGFSSASKDTILMKNSDGNLEWKDKDDIASAIPDNLTITDQDRADGKLSLHGAYDANSNTVPVLQSGGSLSWRPYNTGEEVELEFRGTDGSSATGNIVRFAAADDTAITTNVTKSNGVVVVKIGLHWKM